MWSITVFSVCEGMTFIFSIKIKSLKVKEKTEEQIIKKPMLIKIRYPIVNLSKLDELLMSLQCCQ